MAKFFEDTVRLSRNYKDGKNEHDVDLAKVKNPSQGSLFYAVA